MLLILTTSNEKFSSLIESRLTDSAYFKLNLDVKSLKQTYITVSESDLTISQDTRMISLSQITCVWIKRQSMSVSSEEDINFCGFSDYSDYKLWKDEWNSIIRQIIEHLSFLGIPFFDESANLVKSERKLFQLDVARQVGLMTPDTIVTNSRADAVSFIERNNSECILKISTHPVFKRQENVFVIYSNKVTASDFNDFDSTVNSPVIIQNYIPKEFEVRYTYVYGEHFVCKIESQASDKSKDDYRRYDFANTPYIAISPPDSIKNKVDELMMRLGLHYGALDFIVTPDGEWYFLEINPVGQYGWIELLSGLPITDAILKNILEISEKRCFKC